MKQPGEIWQWCVLWKKSIYLLTTPITLYTLENRGKYNGLAEKSRNNHDFIDNKNENPTLMW